MENYNPLKFIIVLNCHNNIHQMKQRKWAAMAELVQMLQSFFYISAQKLWVEK